MPVLDPERHKNAEIFWKAPPNVNANRSRVKMTPKILSCHALYMHLYICKTDQFLF